MNLGEDNDDDEDTDNFYANFALGSKANLNDKKPSLNRLRSHSREEDLSVEDDKEK